MAQGHRADEWWAGILSHIRPDSRTQTLPQVREFFRFCLHQKLFSVCQSSSFVVIQSLGPLWLSVTPWTAAHQASLSFTISQSLLKLMSIELVMSSSHLILCHPLLLPPSIFPSMGSFSMSQSFALGGQSIGASASASVLPMNTHDWSPLGWTGWISLQSKGLSRVFSTPQFKSINSLAVSLLYGPALTSIHDYWKNHNFDNSDLCQPTNVSAS